MEEQCDFQVHVKPSYTRNMYWHTYMYKQTIAMEARDITSPQNIQ
jgi:hypothetical protein